MYSTEIIAGIKKELSGFNELSVLQRHSDQVCIEVSLKDFKNVCIVLHKITLSAVMMLFAVDERKQINKFIINAVFLDFKRSQWIIINTAIPQEDPNFDSLAKDMHSASLFEREIWEMFGIEPKGNPDLRRLKLHDEVWPQGRYPLRKDFQHCQSGNLGEYKFNKVEGEGVFEIPVGPVHAGIIGPGHFRFSAAGEPIINLEIRLGFTHRGVEKLFEGKDCFEAVKIAECVSGDSCFAHSLAFIRAVEQTSSISVPTQVVYLRAIFLELERMYNHVNDIGGIAVDVGFSFPYAYASLIKEAILQLNQRISGSRYLKGINVIGGFGAGFDLGCRGAVLDVVKKIKQDFNELVRMLNYSVSFMDRVDGTGVLRKKTAEDLGVGGLVGRASGIQKDLRTCFSDIYKEAGFRMMTQESGDVLARLRIRISEFEESCRLIERFIYKLSLKEENNIKPRLKEGSALGYIEGWRGPVLYWVKTDSAGIIQRCKIVDPSVHNWQGLSYAVLGNIVPDFPLCNKSFDLSYSGNDL